MDFNEMPVNGFSGMCIFNVWKTCLEKIYSTLFSVSYTMPLVHCRMACNRSGANGDEGMTGSTVIKDEYEQNVTNRPSG